MRCASHARAGQLTLLAPIGRRTQGLCALNPGLVLQAFGILRWAQQTVLSHVEHAALASRGEDPDAEAATAAANEEEDFERRVLSHREVEVPAQGPGSDGHYPSANSDILAASPIFIRFRPV